MSLTAMLRSSLVLGLGLGLGGVRADAELRFGVVQDGAEQQPIAWQSLSGVELSSAALELSRPHAVARSQELPLAPLELYEIRATMARGPGALPRFIITYEDACGRAQRWSPIWQLVQSPRPDWLPLSPHPQTYIQGLVLPLGAHSPRLTLELAVSDKPQLERYSRWQLTQLRFVALQAVQCCGQLGDNRLAGGDMEPPLRDGLPLGLSQWSKQPPDRLAVIELSDEPARKHVLHIQAGVAVTLAGRAPIPVRRGSAWRMSLWVRGSGRVILFAHSLSDASLVPVRVTNNEHADFDVRSGSWTQLSRPWFAESAHIQLAQMVVDIVASSDLYVDDIELRPYE